MAQIDIEFAVDVVDGNVMLSLGYKGVTSFKSMLPASFADSLGRALQEASAKARNSLVIPRLDVVPNGKS